VNQPVSGCLRTRKTGICVAFDLSRWGGPSGEPEWAGVR